MWQNLIDIFTAPKAVFARILEQPTTLLPLLILVLALASIQLGYFLTSDRGFLIDQVLNQVMDQALAANPSLRMADLRKAASGSINLTLVGSVATISGALVPSVILAITAVYLNFMGKFGHEGRR
jgi:outer membrane protein TolC